MQFHDSTNAKNIPGRFTPRFFRTMSVAMAVAVVVAAAMGRSGTVTASNDEGPRGCSNRTLRGDYGILVSGKRPLGPDVVESFVSSAIRTYDGRGHFTQTDNFFGEIAGYQPDMPASGTYDVHADCSGTSQIFFPGAPGAVDTAFVIVAHGDQVKDAAPGPTTASLWRVDR
jgi:hypothetical protein